MRVLWVLLVVGALAGCADSQQLNSPNHTASGRCDQMEKLFGPGEPHSDCTSTGCYEIALKCWGCYCDLCRDSKCLSQYCDDGYGQCWDPSMFPDTYQGPDVSPDVPPDLGPGDEMAAVEAD